MKQGGSEYRMPIAVPNGIILGLIGVLVLVTPLFEAVPRSKLAMNIIAGSVMIAGGVASALWGLRSRQKTSKDASFSDHNKANHTAE